jgi:hypothetical protein
MPEGLNDSIDHRSLRKKSSDPDQGRDDLYSHLQKQTAAKAARLIDAVLGKA